MMRSRLVLLVEDNGDDAELARRAFAISRVPSRVVVASDGEEALDYLFAEGAHAGRAAQDAPDVVLLDLKLPRLDGHEVLRRIRADDRTCRLPVVVLTSSAEERDIRESYNEGANSYVRKPLDLNDFLRAVAQLSEYWLHRNEIAWDWSRGAGLPAGEVPGI